MECNYAWKSKCKFLNKCLKPFLDACFTDYQMLNGVIINITMKILTPFHCQYQCVSTAGCIAFNFHKWYSQCTMLSSVLSVETDPYYMSAYLTNCNGTIGECYKNLMVNFCSDFFLLSKLQPFLIFILKYSFVINTIWKKIDRLN